MTYRTDDPLADFDRWDAAQSREREELPRCVECGHAIEDDFCTVFNDDPICDECMEKYRKRTADLMG